LVQHNNKLNLYEDVADLHLSSLKYGFLPTLGKKFLKLMYRCIDESKDSVLITIYDKNILKGYVSASLGKRSTYKLMLIHPIKLFLVLFQILYKPKKFLKVVNIVLHMKSKKRSNYPQEELLSIAVNHEYRRQGVAEQLYKELIEYFKNNNVKNFTIIVGKDLEANFFYKKIGAVISDEIRVHNNKISYVYTYKI